MKLKRLLYTLFIIGFITCLVIPLIPISNILASDELVFKTRFSSTVRKHSNVFVTTFYTEPQYIEHEGDLFDLVWYWDNSKKEFYSGKNLFDTSVKDDKVFLTDKYASQIEDTNVLNVKSSKLKSNWKPDITINGKKVAIITGPYITTPDTLEWDYGTFKRQLTLVLGKIYEFYVFDSIPEGDVNIKSNTYKDVDFEYFMEPFGFDTKGTLVNIWVNKDEKFIQKSEFEREDLVYPLWIDDSANFYAGGYTLYQADTVWSTVYNAAEGLVASPDPISSTIQAGTYYTYNPIADGYIRIQRNALFFDTSALNDYAIITAANVYIKPQGVYNWHSGHLYIVEGTSLHSPPWTTDYSYLRTSSNIGGYLSTSTLANETYSAIPLNAYGISWISTTGTTKFGLRSNYDFYNSQPPSTNPYGGFNIYLYASQTKLTVEYSIPYCGLTTIAADDIEEAGATLNGSLDSTGGYSITKRGFVYGTSSVVSNPGNVAPASSGYASNWFEEGTYGAVEYFDKVLTGLDEDEVYYFRAFAYNIAGYVYGSELYFETLTDPVVETLAATNIGISSVTINAKVTDDGNEGCYIRFQYGETEAYGTTTDWEGPYELNEIINKVVTNLAMDTLHHFRAQIYNSVNGSGSPISGSDLTFETETSFYEPTSFSATPYSYEVVVRWTKGIGAYKTVILRKTGSYPTAYNDPDALLVYNDTGASFTDSTTIAPYIIPGQTYFYRAWSYIYMDDTDYYSSDYAEDAATTYYGDESPTTIDEPEEPTGWFILPTPTRMSGMPFYDIINNAADSIAFPRGNFWMLIACVTCAAIGLTTHITIGNTAISIIVMLICMVGCSVQVLIPIWMTFITGMLAMGSVYAFSRG